VVNSGWKVAMESRKKATCLTPSFFSSNVFENKPEKKDNWEKPVN
jgi:hypothetical protein